MDYVQLMGTEDMRNASNQMASAAQEMQRAAARIEHTMLFQFGQRMDEWVERIEAAADKMAKAVEAAPDA